MWKAKKKYNLIPTNNRNNIKLVEYSHLVKNECSGIQILRINILNVPYFVFQLIYTVEWMNI